MNRYHSNVPLVISMVLLATGIADAQGPTVEEKCTIDWAKATAKYVRCLTRAQIRGLKRNLSEEDISLLKSQCEAENNVRLAKAQSRAVRKGGQCATTIAVAPPEIPLDDFEWNGTFKVDDLGVATALTIRGKWQDGFFDLYMQQGQEGDKQKVWVENLIYKNRLYTVTHEWPPQANPPGFPFVGACFKSVNPITVHDLNGILASSRLVGLEIIDGLQMNHFRTTCLSETIPTPFGIPIPEETTRVHIFSDIYVQPGLSTQFERWLQFGDGVGLDPNQDEWFFFKEHNDQPEEIKLPLACEEPFVLPFLVTQLPCKNLETGSP